MSLKNHAIFSSAVFLVVFVLHGFRIFLGWDAAIGGWEVPLWVSWIAVVLAGYLAYSGFAATGYLGRKKA